MKTRYAPRASAAPSSSVATFPVARSAGDDTRAGGASASDGLAPEDTSLEQTSGDPRIAERAYFLYLARDGREGDPIEDWLEAERQILQEDAQRLSQAG